MASSHRAPKVAGRAAAAVAVVGATAGTVALMPGVSQAAPTQTLDQVKAQVATLNQKAEVAGQQFDAAQEQYAKLQQKVSSLQAQITAEQAALDALESSMGLQAAAQYRTGGISPTLQLALNANPETFLSQAGMQSQQAEQEAMLLKSITQDKAQLAENKKNAVTALAEEQTVLAQAAAAKKSVQASLTQEQSLLSTLTAQQRATVTTYGTSTSGYTGALPAASGRAAAAVAYVESKVGKGGYVYGDTGPTYFDCSGLMYAAWAAAGMSIPRTSEEQAAASTTFSDASKLEPGDFIFFYGSSPSHVGMYVGNGMFIDARNESVGIVWGSLDPSSKYYSYMPVSFFGRIG
jgi:cell wall-associated NlpC family hydrolase